ncbi:GNAT family N-acetyltransferase [Georgenia yuyongxinii]|uniref:GNAT family N-acetyltransferase n=1 Tax=Georgenia yuyongxinii TaxID=2589797 RepID=A0A5B8CA93_9MICO|nr:GNAT family N-acetyltransferase [Georgenia yuyongxinii]QDC26345.1 GNAT family N-acetyltransferase [Georgenia yuyongxinii]
MTAVTVRRVGGEDWPTLKAVRLRALDADPAAFTSTLAREEAFTDAVWQERAGAGRSFVACRADAVVGLVSYYAEDGRPRERQLVSMWVAPEARRSGVARALVDAVLDAAAAEGAERLTLFVVDDNEAARRLYEQLGFVATGEVQELPSDALRTEARYALPLASAT